MPTANSLQRILSPRQRVLPLPSIALQQQKQPIPLKLTNNYSMRQRRYHATLFTLFTTLALYLSFIPSLTTAQNNPYYPTDAEFSLQTSPSIPDSTTHKLGPFVIQLDGISTTERKPHVTVKHANDPHKTLWQNIPGLPFLTVARGVDDYTLGAGSFNIYDRDLDHCTHQTIQEFVRVESDESMNDKETVVIKGILRGVNKTSTETDAPIPKPSQENYYHNQKVKRGLVPPLPWGGRKRSRGQNCNFVYEIRFSLTNNVDLKFDVDVRKDPSVNSTDSNNNNNNNSNKKPRIFAANETIGNGNEASPTEYSKTFLMYKSEITEHFYGFGEQFTNWDNKWKKVPIVSKENGIGRGSQPLTGIMNRLSSFSGGDPYATYTAVPHYMTNHGRSLYFENTDYMLFDLTRPDRVVVKVSSLSVQGHILYGKTPLDIIEAYTRYSGRMLPPPEWSLEGAILGLQGGEDRVFKIVNQTIAAQVPVSAVWIQDWVGTKIQTVLGGQQKRLWWNWEYDETNYPNWPNFIQNLTETFNGVRTLSYVNSFLASDVNVKSKFRTNFFQEAASRGYLIKDLKKNPLVAENGPSFYHGTIDLLNPEAYEWFKDVLVREVLGTGVSGWMADFGEYAPIQSSLITADNRKTTTADHNAYTYLWAKLNHEVMQQAANKDDLLIFHRAGTALNPGVMNACWAGDQIPSFDGSVANDGIFSTLVATLTAGLSGYALVHSDIGGFTTFGVDVLPNSKLVRRAELFYRWMELNAFLPVFRTHEGSIPGLNVQFYTDEESLNYFAYNAKLFASMSAYKKELLKDVRDKGWPMIRHLFLHYPEDPNVLEMVDQFMLGSDILVAPVLAPRVRSLKPYLPKGVWTHLWSNTTYDFSMGGQVVTIATPLGQPAVFVKVQGEGDSGKEDTNRSRDVLKPLWEFAKAGMKVPDKQPIDKLD